MRGLKHRGVLTDIANALPTVFQRHANALPTGCVFRPPIPPMGVGTGRPLEGGPTAVAFLRQQIWSASWPILLHVPRGGRAVTTAGSISVVGLRRRRQAMTRHANDDRLFSHRGRDRPEGRSRRARLAGGGICLGKIRPSSTGPSLWLTSLLARRARLSGPTRRDGAVSRPADPR
jgi:hypothetical protein